MGAVYTFGMPRPGSDSFASDYNAELGMRTYRLVHGEDIVPTVAPSEMGFRHVGRFLHCPRLGRFAETDLAPDPSSDAPPFIKGITSEITTFLHSPLAAISGAGAQLRRTVDAIFGQAPPGSRTDPVGILIELLPARIRDHLPDR